MLSGANAETRLVPLNVPLLVIVETRPDGEPAAIKWRGRWIDVATVVDRWRIDDEWWRVPIARLYRRVVLVDDQLLTLYEDMTDGRWYVQRYRLRAGGTAEPRGQASSYKDGPRHR